MMCGGKVIELDVCYFIYSRRNLFMRAFKCIYNHFYCNIFEYLWFIIFIVFYFFKPPCFFIIWFIMTPHFNSSIVGEFFGSRFYFLLGFYHMMLYAHLKNVLAFLIFDLTLVFIPSCMDISPLYSFFTP